MSFLTSIPFQNARDPLVLLKSYGALPYGCSSHLCNRFLISSLCRWQCLKSVGTCTDPGTGVVWLRDLLPFTILTARVLSFGYEANASTFFGDGSADRFQQHALTLIAELEAIRAISSAAERPRIFLCHDLGGILVKKALAHSATQTSKKLNTDTPSIYLHVASFS